jgi:hypothetical protein
MTGKELHYISQAHHKGHLSGDGALQKWAAWLEENKMQSFIDSSAPPL